MTLAALWLRAFALTFFVEAAVAVPMLRAVEPSMGRRLALVLFANLASHPLAYLGLPLLGVDRPTLLLAMEVWAVGSEAVFYRVVRPEQPVSRAIATAALANGASYAVGVVVHAVTGWV